MQPLPPDLLRALTHALSAATQWATVEALTASYDKDAKALIWNSLTQSDRDRILKLKAAQPPTFNAAPYVEQLRGCPLWFYVENILEPLSPLQRTEVLNSCGPELTYYLNSLKANWNEFSSFEYPEGCGVNALTYWSMMNIGQASKGREARVRA